MAVLSVSDLLGHCVPRGLEIISNVFVNIVISKMFTVSLTKAANCAAKSHFIGLKRDQVSLPFLIGRRWQVRSHYVQI